MPTPKIQVIALQPIYIREIGLQLRAGEVKEVDASATTLKSINTAVENGAIRIRQREIVRSPRIPAVGGILQGARQPGGTALSQQPVQVENTAPIVMDTSALEASVERLERRMMQIFEGVQDSQTSVKTLRDGLEERLAALTEKLDGRQTTTTFVPGRVAPTELRQGPSEVSYIPDDLAKTPGQSNVHIAESETSASTSDIAESLKKLKKKGK